MGWGELGNGELLKALRSGDVLEMKM